MTTATTLPLATAQALAPPMAEAAGEIEQERRLPPELFAALAKAGLFRLWIPEAFGGAEADLATLVRVVEEVSSVDGSAGWCVMIGGFFGLFGGCLPAPAAPSSTWTAGPRFCPSMTGAAAARCCRPGRESGTQFL